MPHARSAHQPRTASNTVNIAAKKRSMLKRREKGITASASAPNINARAPRAHLPSLCKLGANSLSMNLFDIAPQVSTVATSQARQRFRVPTVFGLASEATLHGSDRFGLASEATLQGSDRFGLASEAALQGSDRFGLASEATLQGFRPFRPRKRGSAPRFRSFRPRKRGNAPGVRPLPPRKARQRSRVPTVSASQARQR
jgi:hypothetical protein